MNATFAKNQMSHLIPAGLSYRDMPELPAHAETKEGRGFGRKIADAIAYLAAMPRRRAVLDELGALSDRELADIGLARSELNRVFDPAFVNDRSARGTNYRCLGING